MNYSFYPCIVLWGVAKITGEITGYLGPFHRIEPQKYAPGSTPNFTSKINSCHLTLYVDETTVFHYSIGS